MEDLKAAWDESAKVAVGANPLGPKYLNYVHNPGPKPKSFWKLVAPDMRISKTYCFESLSCPMHPTNKHGPTYIERVLIRDHTFSDRVRYETIEMHREKEKPDKPDWKFGEEGLRT